MENEEQKSEYTGKLFLIVGPSGSGKGTVIERIKGKYSGFVYPVSYTTREIRNGEVEGGSYHYVSKEKFEEMIKAGEFLEYAVVHSDNYYGTFKKDILEPLKRGAVVIREVDIQGFNSIRNIVPKANLVSIFMKVSDMEDLKGRILRRGKISDEELQRRFESAKKEIAQAGDCNYQVENKWGEIENCVGNVERIILAEIKSLY
ncbi:guanylate kinase [Candidatus Gracilibacteria bacterium]|jgi:guanylate kinase|nr:guanylate kinase [Candidatus Gracilibacteria bacterium]